MKLLTILSVFTAATAAYSHQHAHPRVNFRNFRRANTSQEISSSSSSTSSKAATTKPAEAFETTGPVAVGTGALPEKSKPVAIGTGGLIEKNRPAVGTGGLVENFQPGVGTGSGATPLPTATPTNGAAITTVVIKTTSVKTIVSCAPTVTNCPARNGTIATGRNANATSRAGVSQILVTETSVLTTVVCPVSDVPKVQSSVSKALLTSTNTVASSKPAVNTPTPTGTPTPTDGGATTTLVVKTTAIKTIISCAPTVTNCPGRDGRPATMTTSMPGVSQVVITETAVLTTVVCPVSDVPKIQSSVSKALETAASAGSSKPPQVLTTVSTEIKETIITRTTQRVVTVTVNPGGDGASPSVITTTVAGTVHSTATVTAVHTVPCSNGACSGGSQDKDKPKGGKPGSNNSGTTTSTATSTGTRTMTVKKPGQTEVSPGTGGGNNNDKPKGGNNGGSQGGNGGSKGGNDGGNQGGNDGGNNCPVCAPAAPTNAAECPPPMTVTVTVTAPAAAPTGPSGGNGGNKDTGSSGGSGGKKETGKANDDKKTPPASGPSTPAPKDDGDDSCDADEEDEKDAGKKDKPASSPSTPGAKDGDDDSCDADEEEGIENGKPGFPGSNSTSTKPSMPMKTGGATKPGKNGTFKAHPKDKKHQSGNSRRSENLF